MISFLKRMVRRVVDHNPSHLYIPKFIEISHRCMFFVMDFNYKFCALMTISIIVDQAEIIQLTGSFLTPHSGTGTRGLVRKVASIYPGTHHYMDAPLYMSSEDLRNQMLEEPLLKSTLSATNTIDIILTGIGSLSSLPLTNSLFTPYVSESDKTKVDDCIGSIYGYVLDKNGEIADLDLNKKVIATPLTNILKTPHRLVVAIGRHKTNVLYHVLRNRLANELLTDSETATTLLEHY